METMPSHTRFDDVKQIKSSTARQAIPKLCYERSLSQAMLWYVIDLMLFFVGIALVFLNPHALIKLTGGIISGTATAMMFVWAHDAAHGALFKSSKVAEILGTLVMLPSLNIYRMWSYGHNKVHHGFTSFSPIDWIWRPLTPKAYRELSTLERVLYRVERSIFTCAFHYLRRIWWSQMLFFNPGKDKAQRAYYRHGKFMVLAYGLFASLTAYFFAGGIIGVLAAVIVPFIVFNYFISMIVYLHHTHPRIPFFDLKKEWSHAVGALYCSTIIHCSKLSRALLHNIMTHIPHHLDTRIPFYHLPKAYQALKEQYGDYFHEYDFKWSYVFHVFKACKLYDFDKKVWMSFKEAEQLETSPSDTCS